MKTASARWLVWIIAIMSALCAWAMVIVIALQVSRIVLDTLHSIVELAGISP